jgi:GABA(A) receptor-associated protein
MMRAALRSSYEEECTLEQRSSDADKVLSRYPDRFPIICERKEGSNDTIPVLDKRKYLVPRDLTVGQFIYVIRKRMSLEGSKALFLFTNDRTIPPTSALISTVYETKKNEDKFLYLFYTGESTFGT